MAAKNPFCVAGECAQPGTFLSGAFGYRATPDIAIEGLAASLGKTTRVIAGAPFDLETSAIGVAVAYRHSFTTRFGASAHVGVARMTTEATPRSGAAVPSAQSERQIRPIAGAQLSWVLTPRLSLLLGLETWQASSQGQPFRHQSLAGGLRASF